MVNKIKKTFTVVQQYTDLKYKYPEWNTYWQSRGKIVTQGYVKPTNLSISYLIKISYRFGKQPEVEVLSPKLKENSKGEKIPHIYPQKKLCLFYPKFDEWTNYHLISETIIPWTSLWLFYYERWHISGKWLGGGIHPEV